MAPIPQQAPKERVKTTITAPAVWIVGLAGVVVILLLFVIVVI